MKFTKRAAVFLVAMLFCVTAIPVSAAAATLTVDSITADVGETIVVPVNITRVDNVASVEVHLSYDSAVLRCVDAQMSDAVSSISWAKINTEPKGYPNEVWLTAVGSSSVALEGMVMSVTFEVLDTACAGVSPLSIEKVTLLDPQIQNLAVEATDGSVTVRGGETDAPAQSTTVTETTRSTTEAAVTTTAKTNADTPVQTTLQGATDPTAATSTDADTSATEQTVTSPNGETIVIPEETVVDIEGNIVTDASGEPTKVRAVAIMLDKLTAAPGETVTVQVTLSAVADLTALGIAVRYDTDALTFEGGECVGFLKDGAGMTAVTENQDGVVDISATASKSISGSGVIAQLHFKVKTSAKSGEYRVSVGGDPLVQSNELELPVKIVAGEIRVEGAEQHSAAGLYAAIGVIAVAAVAAVVVWIVLRRKKKAASVTETERPAVVDVSGEDEE